MKNAINYYYNLIVKDIHQLTKMYYFDYDNSRYFLVLYNDDMKKLNYIYNLHKNILARGLYIHQIVLNKDGGMVTIINNKPYILIKAQYYTGKIDYGTMISFLNLEIYEDGKSLLEKMNWSILWGQKNDYLEYLMNQMGHKYPILRDSFSYYIGLGETSIQLLNMIDVNNVPKVVAHQRIKSTDTLFEIYNPLNLTVDYRVRDIAEYFKSAFFNGEDITKILNEFLVNNSLSEIEYLLFLARLLYPTYYFDIFEDIISGKKEEKEIKKIIALIDNYEILLKKIYLYYKTIIKIMPIEWLEN